jgi:hypothetical protein
MTLDGKSAIDTYRATLNPNCESLTVTIPPLTEEERKKAAIFRRLFKKRLALLDNNNEEANEVELPTDMQMVSFFFLQSH